MAPTAKGPTARSRCTIGHLFISTVRRLQPNACIFSDGGPDVRWVGNESGLASETNWSTLDKAGFYPGSPRYRELGEGHENGTDWLPAECDVSIRPGWFFHPKEDANRVKTPAQIEEPSITPRLAGIRTCFSTFRRTGTVSISAPKTSPR